MDDDDDNNDTQRSFSFLIENTLSFHKQKQEVNPVQKKITVSYESHVESLTAMCA